MTLDIPRDLSNQKQSCLQFLALPGKTGEGEAAGGVMTVTDVTTLGLAVPVAVAVV